MSTVNLTEVLSHLTLNLTDFPQILRGSPLLPPHYRGCSGSGQGRDRIWSGRWGRDSRPSGLRPAAPALPTADLLPLLVASENLVWVVLWPAERQECGSSRFKSSPLLPGARVGCLLSRRSSGIWSTACGWTAAQGHRAQQPEL